jgi:choline dehydrogenase-like flavoprotein
MQRPAERLTTQDLVVGSGAGGATVAATLARAGRTVLIAEEGPGVDTSQMATHSPDAMRLLYRQGGLSPILGSARIAFVEGRCVGGSTEINSALWMRTQEPAIDRWRERFGVRELSYEDHDALIDRLEAELEITSLNSPSPPLSSALFRRGMHKMGFTTVEIPRAQRGELAGSQFAPNAKRSMSRTLIPRAREAGATLLADCRITRLVHRKGRVLRVHAIQQGEHGAQRLEIEAENVFVCAGATQTPALLRSGGIKRNVGNSLCIHPMLKVAAEFDQPLDSHRAALPIYQVTDAHPDVTLGGAVFTPGFLAMTLADNWNENEAALRNWRNMALYYAACRGTAMGSVRVIPGTREAVVRYSLSTRDRINLSAGLARLCEGLFAAGARRIYPSLRGCPVIRSPEEARSFLAEPIPVARMSLSTVHSLSSCPMGENEQRCAVDSFGRVRDFENLYLADASVIPDSPTVNPQCTVMALALRIASRFLEDRQ